MCERRILPYDIKILYLNRYMGYAISLFTFGLNKIYSDAFAILKFFVLDSDTWAHMDQHASEYSENQIFFVKEKKANFNLS